MGGQWLISATSTTKGMNVITYRPRRVTVVCYVYRVRLAAMSELLLVSPIYRCTLIIIHFYGFNSLQAVH